MKILAVVLIAFAFITGGVLFLTKDHGGKTEKPTETVTSEKTDSIESVATFGIFTNSTFRIFDDTKYFNQSEEVYMEEANTVIVKREKTTWDEFFKTLPMKLTHECLTTGTGQIFCSNDKEKLRFFINNKENPSALNKEIKNGDVLLVSFGNKSDEEIKNELNRISSL